MLLQSMVWMRGPSKLRFKRKTHDRISNGQFKQKTNLSPRSISQSLQKLVERGLISAYDQNGELLPTTLSRKGNPRIYYSPRLAP
jgi:DNA-binding transcriptional ArsR family regulator